VGASAPKPEESERPSGRERSNKRHWGLDEKTGGRSRPSRRRPEARTLALSDNRSSRGWCRCLALADEVGTCGKAKERHGRKCESNLLHSLPHRFVEKR
jgi:hypothetical protein